MARSSSPQVPVVNAGAMYINGLELVMNGTNPDTYFNVLRGAARNSTNINDIILQNDVTVNINARGALGLDVGTIEEGIVYAVYVIGSSIASLGNGQEETPYPTTVLISASYTHPILPFGYDMSRRIGTITTDVSTLIVPFVQTGNSTNRAINYGEAGTVLLNGNDTDWTVIPLISGVPPIATLVYFNSIYETDDTDNDYRLQPTGQASDNPYVVGSAPVTGVSYRTIVSCPCNNVPAINYEVDDDAAGNALTLSVIGFEDVL